MVFLIVKNLGIKFGVSEEVPELELKSVGVIEGLDMARALQVEPEDGVHDALVVEDAVFQRLLEHAVDVVLFQGLALVGPLHRRLVKKVHA